MVMEFAAGMVLAGGAFTDVDEQISKYNPSSLGKTTSSSSMTLAFQP
jgi:hypothetical protein